MTLMRQWERAVFKLRNRRVYIYNRTSGVRANKNYKTWCKIAEALRSRDFDSEAYFEWRLAVTYGQLPWPAQIAFSSWLDRFEKVRHKWQRRTDRYRAEIADGAATMATILATGFDDDPGRAAEALEILWSTLPVTWLAMSQVFWDCVKQDRIELKMSPDYFTRVSKLHSELKKDKQLAGDLAAYFQKETATVVYS